MSISVESRIAMNWRLKGQRYRLEGSNCQHCKTLHFPARQICPDCGEDNKVKPASEYTQVVYLAPNGGTDTQP